MQVDIVFLKNLIRIPSVSADVDEINRAVDFTVRHAEERGLFCVVETNAEGRKMAWVANVDGKLPDVLLSAHLDVVSAQNPDLFEPREADGVLFGRGASDCKDHVALSLHLMERLKGRVSIGAVFGTDEEIGGRTTDEMINRGYAAKRLVIVLDSEQFAITTWQKGLARYIFESETKPVHSGMIKGAAPNAILNLIRAYEAVSAVISDSEDGSWRDVLTLSRMTGTSTHAELEICVRTANYGGFDAVEALLREKFGSDPRCLRKGEAVLLDETEPYLIDFLDRMRRQWPERDCRFFHLNSSTDARHIQRLGLPMLILGVDGRGAHTPDEHLNIVSLGEYADLIADYLVDEYACA